MGRWVCGGWVGDGWIGGGWVGGAGCMHACMHVQLKLEAAGIGFRCWQHACMHACMCS